MLAISFISAVNRKRKKRREARGLGSSTDDDSEQEAHKPEAGAPAPASPRAARPPPASISVCDTARAGQPPPRPGFPGVVFACTPSLVAHGSIRVQVGGAEAVSLVCALELVGSGQRRSRGWTRSVSGRQGLRG
uniref:Uncharacterized protein n=1 Tax=Bos mutus grunniens TaxID=30521 RepID=A0A8B9XSJ9_BOSMU